MEDIMNREERIIKIRKEIEELKQMKKQLILLAGYSNENEYYKDLAQRNNKEKILINNINIDKAA